MRAFSLVMLLLLAACRDEGTTTPPTPVVGVVVTPLESPPLRGGDSFQFSAQAQDENGDALPNSIVWSIGDPELATISQSGLVTILAGTGHGSGAIAVIATTEGKQGQASVPIHDWSFEESGDPLLGSRIRVAHITSETGPTDLYVRCQAPKREFQAPPLHTGFDGINQLQVYVTTGEPFTTTKTVRFRLDNQAEAGETWIFGSDLEDSGALFYPSDTRSFAEMISEADTLRVEHEGTPPYTTGVISYTFAVRGLEHYIGRLFENCLAGIFKVSGDNQTAMVGSELPNPIVVELRSPDGAPAAGAGVGWMTVGAHSGQVSSLGTSTDNEGHASVTWTVGSNDVSSLMANSEYGITTFHARVVKFETTTTITSVQPEPSVVGQEVTISFAVVGSGGIPSRSVAVFTTDGSAETCFGVLSSGSGSCNLTFTAPGNHLITARYLGDDRYNNSEDTEEHQVN